MQQFDFDMSTKYVKIVQAANANGVTIYTLDASGLTTADVMSADTEDEQGRPHREFSQRQNMQGPIRMMAEETGGNGGDQHQRLEVEPGRDRGGLLQLLLPGLPQRAGRGATARTRSRSTSKRKGLRVRTRTSYVEKSVETRTAEAVVASLSYPRTDNPLNASLSVGQAKPHDRENYALPVRISVPIARSASFPSGDLYEGQFLVYFVVRDASGNQSDLQVQRQEVEIPAKDFAAAQRKDFYYDATLVVVPGGQKLVDRRARLGLEPDVLPPEERLRVGPSGGGQARARKAGLLASRRRARGIISGCPRDPRSSSSRERPSPAA